jgi:hypothetical protein
MLPFLKPKKVAAVIVANRQPDGSMESEGSEDEMDPGLMAVAEDLIRAVHGKDARAVAQALQAAFDIADSIPHVEGPHED